MAHFEIYPDAAGKHRHRLVADSGEVLHTSKGYPNAEEAEAGARDLVYAVHGTTLSTRGGGWASSAAIPLDVRRVES